MKALKNWFSRRGALPLTAYLLALAVWLVLGAAHFGSDPSVLNDSWLSSPSPRMM